MDPMLTVCRCLRESQLTRTFTQNPNKLKILKLTNFKEELFQFNLQMLETMIPEWFFLNSQIFSDKTSLNKDVKESLAELLQTFLYCSEQFSTSKSIHKFHLLSTLPIFLQSFQNSSKLSLLFKKSGSLTNEKWYQHIRSGLVSLLSNKLDFENRCKVFVLIESFLPFIKETFSSRKITQNIRQEDEKFIELSLQVIRIELHLSLEEEISKFQKTVSKKDEKKTSKKIIGNCYSITEKIIDILVQLSTDTLFNLERLSRIHQILNESFTSIMIYLQEVEGYYALINNNNKQESEEEEEEDKEIVIGSIRILGCWLKDDEPNTKLINQFISLIPFIFNFNEKVEIDTIRFLLPGLSSLTGNTDLYNIHKKILEIPQFSLYSQQKLESFLNQHKINRKMNKKNEENEEKEYLSELIMIMEIILNCIMIISEEKAFQSFSNIIPLLFNIINQIPVINDESDKVYFEQNEMLSYCGCCLILLTRQRKEITSLSIISSTSIFQSVIMFLNNISCHVMNDEEHPINNLWVMSITAMEPIIKSNKEIKSFIKNKTMLIGPQPHLSPSIRPSSIWCSIYTDHQ